MAAFLARRSLPAWAAVLALMLALPSLGVGWVLDDYYHRTVLLGTSRFRDLLGPPWEMFRFFRGDPDRTTRVMDVGLFPWWTYPGLKAEFFQPLTVVTHLLDYRLWPDSPALMHAQSLAWFGALVALAGCNYRRTFGRTWQAGVAMLMFAVDDAHGTPVGWIANRNSLIAATFGVSALILHDRWRREGWRAGSLLAPLLFGAALCAKEEGIATFAYLAAHALFLDPAGRARGCLALSPYFGILVVWRYLRASWGYGVHDMGLYVDPLADPGRFALAAVDHAPILLLGQLGLPPADVAIVLRPAGRAILWWFAVTVMALISWAIAPILRRDRLARFWATGLLFSVIPVCATFPMDRLLTFPGVGACGFVACILGTSFGDSSAGVAGGRRRRRDSTLGFALIAVHLVIAPIALPIRAGAPTGPRTVEDRLYVGVPPGPHDEARTVVVVNAPSLLHAGYLPLRRELSGEPIPRHVRVLAPGIPEVSIRRPDERTIVIRPARGYLDWIPDRLFRSERRPLRLGDRVGLTGMTAEVIAVTDGGRPAEVAFRFDVPLEDHSLEWLCYRGGRFRPFTPPDVGGRQDIRIGGLLDLGRRAEGPD